jgi:hypothetical protein
MSTAQYGDKHVGCDLNLSCACQQNLYREIRFSSQWEHNIVPTEQKLGTRSHFNACAPTRNIKHS